MRRETYRLAASLLALTGLAGALHAQAQNPQPYWLAVSTDFVQQILSRSGNPAAVSVSFQNISSLGSEEQASLQNAILTTLHDAGVRLVKPELALADVQITFSEDWHGYVWVAAVKQGPGTQWIIKKLPHPQRAAGPKLPQMNIRKTVVWQQDARMLDFLQDGQNMVILEPDEVVVYTNDSGQWRSRQTLTITHDQPWPRDLRGRLQLSGTQITAFLPGTRCSGELLAGSLQCASTDDPWPIETNTLAAFFSPARNFFTGVLSGANAGQSVPPFYSGAALENAGTPAWIFAGTDGQARLYADTVAAPVATFKGWGSNIAGIHSACGSGWQVLVSSPADSTQPDSVQAIEVVNREAAAVSPATEFSGPIRALWTGGDGQSVNVIVESLTTGRYEALTLTIGCSQ